MAIFEICIFNIKFIKITVRVYLDARTTYLKSPKLYILSQEKGVSHWMEMKQEREVQWLAKLRGGQFVQKGRFLVQE